MQGSKHEYRNSEIMVRKQQQQWEMIAIIGLSSCCVLNGHRGSEFLTIQWEQDIQLTSIQ